MTSPRQIVVSVDYEIFGNGTGDVRQHVTGPTEHMARTLEEAGAPLTVFVEMEEQVAFERNAPALRSHFGYDPAELIRQQVGALARRGHDFQLHLHPQWHRSAWTGTDWRLQHDVHTVDALHEEQAAATEHLRERKAQLESYAGQPVTTYRCGAFAAQPGGRLLRALEANHFIIESSVVCGLRRDEPHVQLDYRRAPSDRRMWRVSTDVAVRDDGGALTEVPIHSVMGRRWQQVTWQRLQAKFSRHVPKQRQDEMMNQFGISKRRPLGLLKFLMSPVPLKLDFHNVTPGRLLQWIRSAPAPHPDDPLDVLVLIGHTKEHINPGAFEEFVRLVKRDNDIRIVSFSEVARQLTEQGRASA